MGLIRDLGKLKPKTQEAARTALGKLDALGVKYFVNETLRVKETQEAYYAQGRDPLNLVNGKRKVAGLWAIGEDENKYFVTHTMKSRHIDGVALDVYPTDSNGNPKWDAKKPEYKQIAEVLKLYGFEWGGDWTDFPDLPHFQFKGEI